MMNLLLFSLLNVAAATHFRFANLYWSRAVHLASNTNSMDVTFTLEQGWRLDFISPLNVNFGDNTATWAASGLNSANAVSKSTTDNWGIWANTVDHTYGNKQQYSVSYGSCCRISSLAEGNNDKDYDMTILVDMRDNSATHSPTTTGVPIVQMIRGVTTSYPQAAAHSSHPMLSRWATVGESGLFRRVPGSQSNNAATLTSDGVLTWTPQINGLYAVQIVVEAHPPGSPSNILVSSAVDFIIEVIEPSNDIVPQVPEFDFTNGQPDFLGPDGNFKVCDTGDLDIDFYFVGESTDATAKVKTVFNAPAAGMTISDCLEGQDANGFAPGPKCTRRVVWDVQPGELNGHQFLVQTESQGVIQKSAFFTPEIEILDCGFFGGSIDARCDGVAL